jgi:8-oxo-dGTP diphosphatase
MDEIPKTYYRVSIKGLILDESKEKFMIVLEDNGYWELPGGGLDAGESIQDCLAREIKEEMGLTVTRMVSAPSYVLVGLNMKGKQSVNLVYEMSVDSMNFTPSSECTEIRFVTPSEALALNAWRNVKELATMFDHKNTRLD